MAQVTHTQLQAECLELREVRHDCLCEIARERLKSELTTGVTTQNNPHITCKRTLSHLQQPWIAVCYKRCVMPSTVRQKGQTEVQLVKSWSNARIQGCKLLLLVVRLLLLLLRLLWLIGEGRRGVLLMRRLLGSHRLAVVSQEAQQALCVGV